MKKLGPDFIGIGAAHAGLGVVTQLLSVHPGMAQPIPALHFFSTDAYTEQGCTWYEAQLKRGAKLGQVGDCSPDYLTSPVAAERIVERYPDTKLFVVVRNPIDRAIAAYTQAQVTGRVSTQISCARYLATMPVAQTDGFYGQHLHRFFGYYSSLQLHIIVYEDFVQEPLKTMQKLYEFLGLDVNYIPTRLAAYAPPPDEPKYRSRLSRVIHFVAVRIKKMREKPVVPIVPPAFTPSTYFSSEELQTFKAMYATDSAHLSNLLHRDMVVAWELGIEAGETS